MFIGRHERSPLRYTHTLYLYYIEIIASDHKSSFILFCITYSFAAAKELKNYEYYLRKTPSFNDPRAFECLMQELGLSTTEYYTNMSGLKGKFPQSDYAGELRNSQASKWAFR